MSLGALPILPHSCRRRHHSKGTCSAVPDVVAATADITRCASSLVVLMYCDGSLCAMENTCQSGVLIAAAQGYHGQGLADSQQQNIALCAPAAAHAKLLCSTVEEQQQKVMRSSTSRTVFSASDTSLKSFFTWQNATYRALPGLPGGILHTQNSVPVTVHHSSFGVPSSGSE